MSLPSAWQACQHVALPPAVSVGNSVAVSIAGLLLQEKGEFTALQLKSAVKVVVVVSLCLGMDRGQCSSLQSCFVQLGLQCRHVADTESARREIQHQHSAS